MEYTALQIMVKNGYILIIMAAVLTVILSHQIILLLLLDEILSIITLILALYYVQVTMDLHGLKFSTNPTTALAVNNSNIFAGCPDKSKTLERFSNQRIMVMTGLR